MYPPSGGKRKSVMKGFFGGFLLLLVFASCTSFAPSRTVDYGYPTTGGANNASIAVKDYETLGIIIVKSTEVIDGNGNHTGSKVTYEMLMIEAQKLYADDIINIRIDVQQKEEFSIEGILIRTTFNYTATALAIKYTTAVTGESVSNISSNMAVEGISNRSQDIVTEEIVVKKMENIEPEFTGNTALNPRKFIFGINANAGGALGYLWQGGTGAGVSIELGKGNFISEISLMVPSGGFGFLATFNRFWPSRIGGFYLGGGAGFLFFQYDYYDSWYYYYNETVVSIPLGVNAGYKFVTKPGLYFRTGIFVGFDFGWLIDSYWFDLPVFIKPELAVGWTMR